MADPDLAGFDAAITALDAAIEALTQARAAQGDPAELALNAAMVEEAAAALGPATDLLGAIAAPDLHDERTLPMTTGVDRIVTMVRDPESVCVYWELTPAGVGRAKAAHDGPSGLVLRIYTIPDAGEPSVRDIDTHEWLGRTTVHVAQPGQRVVCAIGFKRDDVFMHVAQAAAVRLPRRAPGTGKIVFSAGEKKPLSARIVRPTIVHIAGAKEAPTGPQLDPRIDSAALRGFTQGQALAGEVLSDLNRVVGSNHLIPSDRSGGAR